MALRAAFCIIILFIILRRLRAVEAGTCRPFVYEGREMWHLAVWCGWCILLQNFAKTADLHSDSRGQHSVGVDCSRGGLLIKNVRHTYALNMSGSHVRARRPQPHPDQVLLQEGVFWASWLGNNSAGTDTHAAKTGTHRDMTPIYRFERKSSPAGVRSRLPESA